MRGWSRSSCRSDRRGLGAIFAFVLWVLAIALIYALSQSQAQSGALTGVARVAAMRAVVFAGESALEEASHVIRNPSGETSTVSTTTPSSRATFCAIAGWASPSTTRARAPAASTGATWRRQPSRFHWLNLVGAERVMEDF